MNVSKSMPVDRFLKEVSIVPMRIFLIILIVVAALIGCTLACRILKKTPGEKHYFGTDMNDKENANC